VRNKKARTAIFTTNLRMESHRTVQASRQSVPLSELAVGRAAEPLEVGRWAHIFHGMIVCAVAHAFAVHDGRLAVQKCSSSRNQCGKSRLLAGLQLTRSVEIPGSSVSGCHCGVLFLLLSIRDTMSSCDNRSQRPNPFRCEITFDW